jgi:fatty-acyl-CoA synthase
MDTQEIDRTIKRACRNTIGDAISRSTGCNPEKDALFDHEAVSEVAVIGLPDEKWIEAVSAVAVAKKDAETENLREELEEHARGQLADFKRPKHIFFVEDLPRNAAGKILKCELRSRFATERWSGE